MTLLSILSTVSFFGVLLKCIAKNGAKKGNESGHLRDDANGQMASRQIEFSPGKYYLTPFNHPF